MRNVASASDDVPCCRSRSSSPCLCGSCLCEPEPEWFPLGTCAECRSAPARLRREVPRLGGELGLVCVGCAGRIDEAIAKAIGQVDRAVRRYERRGSGDLELLDFAGLLESLRSVDAS